MSNPNSKTQFYHIEWKTLRKHLLTTSFDPYLDDWFGKIFAIVVADVPVPVEGTGPALKYCGPAQCTSHRRRRPTWNRQGKQRQRTRSSGSRSPTMSKATKKDLQLREEPAGVKNVLRKVPESQSLGWRPSGSGDGAHRSWGRRPPSTWGRRGGGRVPLSFAAGPARLDRSPRASPNHVWGWCCRRERGSLRRGTPPALSLCVVGSRPS